MYACIVAAPAMADPPLREYPTRYYTIFTDLDEETVHDATLRITMAAEEYARRTSSFTGRITKRLPFYLFQKREDYLAAGGLPKSAGVFKGDRLMAVAGETISDRTWKIVQHEGFHQFVRAVMGGDIPVWVNEGMAEYFEEAVFTGQGFVVGLIPPKRLRRVKKQMAAGGFRSVQEMMQLGRGKWNEEMHRENYDQAWSMVYFLAHGDGGVYRQRFEEFLRDISRKSFTWEQAWLANFGRGIDDFERTWRDYWTSQPDNPSDQEYAKITVQVLTEFLARAHSQGQHFDDGLAFIRAAASNQLKTHPNDWLPRSLLKSALLRVSKAGLLSLEPKGRKPPQLCMSNEKAKICGTFEINRERVQRVEVQVTPKP